MPKKTEALPTDEDLRKTQLLLKASLDSPKDIIIVSLDQSYRYQYFNAAHRAVMRKVFGVDIAIGKSLLDCIPDPKLRQRVKVNFDHALAGETHATVEEYGSDPIQVFEGSYNPVIDEHGQIIGATAFARDITKRKQAENALQASQSQMVAALASMTDAVFIANDTGEFVRMNEAFASFHRFKSLADCPKQREDYHQVLEFFQEDGEPIPPECLPVSRALRGESGTNTMMVLRRKDSAETWIGSYSFNPIREPAGRIIGAVVVARDITEQKKSEQVLKETSERLALATSSGELGVWDWDILDNHIVWNERMYEIYDRKPNSLDTIDDWVKTVHPDDVQAAIDSGLTAIEGGKPYRAIFRVCRPDDRIAHIKAEGVVLRDATGKAIRMIGINSDITEQKLAEQAIQESEQKFAAAFMNSPVAIMLVDPFIGTFIDVNDTFLQTMEYRRDEVVGKTTADLQLFVEDQVHVDMIQELKTHQRFSNWESRFRTKSGKILHDLVSSSLIKIQGKTIQLTIAADITERKRAEEALWYERTVLTNVMETSPVGITTFNVNGIITYANPMAIKILELSPNVINHWSYDSEKWRVTDLAGHTIKKNNSAFGIIMESHQSVYNLQQLVQFPDGRSKTLSINAAPLQDEAGRFSGMVSTVSDISEQKRIEQSLLQSEQRYRSLFTEMSEGFAVHEIICNEQGTPIDYRFLEVNPAFEKLTGLAKGAIVGQTVRQVMPNTESYWIERYGQVALTGKPDNFENYAKELDRYYHVAVFSPEIGQFAVFFNDITKRKRIEQTVLDEKERLAVTLRSIGDGVITTDIHGNVESLNRAAEQMTGWTTADAIGRPLPEVFHIINELTHLECENPVQRVLATGGIVELANHTCLVPRTGQEIVIADSGAPIRDKNSQIIGVVLVFRDMSEKQRLDDSLQRAQKLESLGLLAGGIAHDFNNLLGGIFGYLEMANESLAGKRLEQVPQFISKAMGAFERARALTKQLLTFAKGGAPIRKTLQLAPLVRKSAQFALSGSNVACQIQVPDDLWLCDCDENQIGQVIDNLVINAKQAMSSGGKILLSGQNVSMGLGQGVSNRSGKFVRISVRDFGIGIPKEIQDRIFDPFFSTKETGHGLGLATVFSIVQRHDGWVDLESEPGQGSTFHVYIPASVKVSAEAYDPILALHQGSGNILVMDDEDFMLEISSFMLQKMGYTVWKAKEGVSAIKIVAEAEESGNPIKACILDLTIRDGMGGKETVTGLRAINPGIVLIAASGYSEDPVMAQPLEHGFNEKIIKPFRKTELAELLEALLVKR